MLLGNCIGPCFDGRSGDLDGTTAVAAHKVVMMLRTALPVERLTLVSDEQINLSGIGEGLQGAVDGCQADGCALLAQ